jgi:hypothetical protein
MACMAAVYRGPVQRQSKGHCKRHARPPPSVRRILPGGKQFRSEPLRPPQRSRDHNGWLKPKRHLLCACVRVKGGCRRLVEATPDTKKSTTDTCHDFCSYAHAHARTGRHCTLLVGSSRRMRMHVYVVSGGDIVSTRPIYQRGVGAGRSR